MLMQGITDFVSSDAITEQIAVWWAEAETAARTEQIPRARRFLRWILAIQPYDKEAWLRLAELASTPKSQMAYLRQAIAFHPDSPRVMTALRQARARQLELAVPGLLPRSLPLHCLPDQRRNGHHYTAPRNGKQAKPADRLEAETPFPFRSIRNLF